MTDVISSDLAAARVHEQILERLAALEAENATSKVTVADLTTTGPGATGQLASTVLDESVSRRGLFRRLGAAMAAGAGLALGGTVLRPDTAAAAEGAFTGSDSVPALTVDQTGTGDGIRSLTASGPGLNSQSQDSVGVFGVSHTKNGILGLAFGTGLNGVMGKTSSATSSGVYGENDAGGYGVAGRSNEADGTGVWGDSLSGIGVKATGGRAPLLLVPSASVGAPSSGSHTKGEICIDSNGVLWLCTVGDGNNVGTWAQAITGGVNGMGSANTTLSSSGQPLRAIATGTTGEALVGQTTNASNPSSAVYGNGNGTGPSVNGVATGTGAGVYGQVTNSANGAAGVQGTTSGTGSGVVGLITNNANSAAAVRGATSGMGYGVQGQVTNPSNASAAVLGTTAGIGIGVFGQITNAASAAAAVRGSTVGTGSAVTGINTHASSGRGGFFQGPSAALRLAPASGSHPSSGLAGDLFVDSSNNLWFCKGGSTWVQAA